MDRGAWWATVHGVAKSQTRLSYLTFFLSESNKVHAGSQINTNLEQSKPKSFLSPRSTNKKQKYLFSLLE